MPDRVRHDTVGGNAVVGGNDRRTKLFGWRRFGAGRHQSNNNRTVVSYFINFCKDTFAFVIV